MVVVCVCVWWGGGGTRSSCRRASAHRRLQSAEGRHDKGEQRVALPQDQRRAGRPGRGRQAGGHACACTLTFAASAAGKPVGCGQPSAAAALAAAASAALAAAGAAAVPSRAAAASAAAAACASRAAAPSREDTPRRLAAAAGAAPTSGGSLVGLPRARATGDGLPKPGPFWGDCTRSCFCVPGGGR